MNTVVLANGLFPTHEVPLRILREASLIVCCDGAIDKLYGYLRDDVRFGDSLSGRRGGGAVEVAVVGDGDSRTLEGEVEQLFARYGTPLIHYSESEQESNDLTKAIRFATSRGARNVSILGATGLREDHTLGNISLLAQYAELITVQMYTDHGVFTPIQFNTTFRSFPRQQVSVFNLTPCFTINSRGLQYPISERNFSQWWEGTLNACLGDEFQINVNTCGASPENRRLLPRVLVFQTYEPKSC